MAGTKLALTVGATALLLAACGSSGTSGNTAANTAATHSAGVQPPAAPAGSAPAPATSSSAPASAGSLSGTWDGQYGGAYQGTFVLRWHQSGSRLGGSIHISSPDSSLSIHGTVANGAIQFGTVGSYAITYSGTVSGDSMSGTYKAGGAQGGNWSASKS